MPHKKIRFNQTLRMPRPDAPRKNKKLILSFAHIHPKYNLIAGTAKQKANLIDKIHIWSQQSYVDLLTQRKISGIETIPRQQISPLPPISEDVAKLAVLRFGKGNDRLSRLIGYFDGTEEIFYVTHVDYNGETYKH